MFLDFYHLREQPFSVSPDPRYLYFSPGHREALASLFYGIETGRGFLALIAEPGMGKTSLLFQLLERLKGTIRSAFLFQTQCDSRELLRYLLEALGIDSREQDLVQLHARLNQFLLGEASAGRRVVVFIDEAQNLSDSALETVRLLSNFEAADRKLFQIVLSGQPELARRLKNSSLAQLRQRIAVLTGLKPLPAVETFQYIHHRLEVAGYDGPELFTSSAIDLIAHRSHGIPRNINNLCFNAMSLGCAMGSRKIGPELVQEAVNDLSLDNLVPKSRSIRPFAPLIGRRRETLAARGGPRPSVDWLRSRVLENRTLQTVVLSALLGSLATYIGAHTGNAIVHSASTVAVAADSGQRAAAYSPLERSASASHPDPSQQRFFTYVVQPNDTIWDLCVWSLGRYDESALAELRNLNPDLKNPDRIEVGQQVRLPVRRPN